MPPLRVLLVLCLKKPDGRIFTTTFQNTRLPPPRSKNLPHLKNSRPVIPLAIVLLAAVQFARVLLTKKEIDMSKKVKKGKSPRQVRGQRDLFDHRPRKSKKIKTMVDAIVAAQHEYDEVAERLDALNNDLLFQMKKLKMTEYDHDGVSIVVVHTTAKDRVKIKVSSDKQTVVDHPPIKLKKGEDREDEESAVATG